MPPPPDRGLPKTTARLQRLEERASAPLVPHGPPPGTGHDARKHRSGQLQGGGVAHHDAVPPRPSEWWVEGSARGRTVGLSTLGGGQDGSTVQMTKQAGGEDRARTDTPDGQ